MIREANYGNPVSVTMPRRGIREDENTIIRQECTHAFPGYFQSSSSFLIAPQRMQPRERTGMTDQGC